MSNSQSRTRSWISLALAMPLVAAACGGGSDDSGGWPRPSANEDSIPTGALGTDTLTVDDVSVSIASAVMGADDAGEPIITLQVESTNNGTDPQPKPRPYLVCANGELAINAGGSYQDGIPIQPGETVSGDVILSFGEPATTECGRPVEIDVRFGATLGGVRNVVDGDLSTATFSVDDSLVDDAAVFGG